MIKGQNVILRTVKETDIDQIFNFSSDLAEVGDYWSVSLPSAILLKNMFKETGIWENDGGMMLITNHEGEILGQISFFKGYLYQVGYEVGFRIYKNDQRGKGFLTEALRIFCAYLFELKPINRLQVNTLKGNYACRRVAEKCGLVYEGTMRKATFKRGTFQDLELLSLLREDSPKLMDLIQR